MLQSSNENPSRYLYRHSFYFFTPLSARSDIDVIIPRPQKIESGAGRFILTDKTRYFSQTPLSRNALDYLQEHLKRNAGYILSEAASPQENSLLFKYDGELGEEAYRLRSPKHRSR